jgi:hypothetical protein
MKSWCHSGRFSLFKLDVIKEFSMQFLLLATAVLGLQKRQDRSGLPVGIPEPNPVPPGEFCRQQNGFRNADGTQIRNQVSCSSTSIGQIPTRANMVSSLIVEPRNRATVQRSQEIRVRIQTRNMVSGFFSNATTQYYVSPQSMDNGNVQGHYHITCQRLDGNNVLDPTRFDFFRGINDPAPNRNRVAGNNRDTLEAVIPPNTLPSNGEYRICGMTGTFTHQPILSPVMRRGPIEDCIRVFVQ